MNRYYAVVYCKDGTIHLWPGDSQEECLGALNELKENPKILKRMMSTTVIKRDMDNFKDGLIFGSPKSLNVIKEGKKK